MGLKLLILPPLLVAVFGIIAYNMMCQEIPLPKLDENAYWGPGPRKEDDQTIRPFKIQVSDEDLKDFHTRLNLPLRLTAPLEGSAFNYGFNNNALPKLLDYWKKKYDWRKREAILNKLPHFKTEIEGLNIHFLHIKPTVPKSSNVKVLPLILTHGWPGSFIEFLDIIPLLTTPKKDSKFVFELVIPSLPGYGFSDGSSKQGLGALETAQIFKKLMNRLGFEKFYAQGGDWGSLVTTLIGTFYPESVLGVHVNMVPAMRGISLFKMVLVNFLPSGLIVAKEDEYKISPISNLLSMLIRETGYMHLQASKPDTIGTALNTSPVALYVYIMEKFSGWTNMENINDSTGGLSDPNFPLDMDKMLDNICIYWFTKSIVTSQRYYAENMKKSVFAKKIDEIPCNVPAGYASFSNELLNIPEAIAKDKFPNLIAFKNMNGGGHFAAMEKPQDLAEDIFYFVSLVE